MSKNLHALLNSARVHTTHQLLPLQQIQFFKERNFVENGTMKLVQVMPFVKTFKNRKEESSAWKLLVGLEKEKRSPCRRNL